MRLVKFALLSAVVCLATGSYASAAILFSDSIVPGVNSYQDQSRDTVVDVNGDKLLGIGDILYGFARLDDQTFPANPLELDSLYIVFSQKIKSFDTTNGHVFFEPVSSGTYSIASLTGDASITGNTYFAVYEKAGGFGSLLTNNAGNAANIGTISAGTLLLTAGEEAGSDDFWAAAVTNANAIDLTKVIPVGSAIANFTAGLSVLTSPGLPGVSFNELVEANVPWFTLADPTLHELGISGGTVTGNGVAGLGPFNDTSGPYSYVNQLEATINANVGTPEPASMLLWTGLAAFGAFRARRRKTNVAA